MIAYFLFPGEAKKPVYETFRHTTGVGAPGRNKNVPHLRPYFRMKAAELFPEGSIRQPQQFVRAVSVKIRRRSGIIVYNQIHRIIKGIDIVNISSFRCLMKPLQIRRGNKIGIYQHTADIIFKNGSAKPVQFIGRIAVVRIQTYHGKIFSPSHKRTEQLSAVVISDRKKNRKIPFLQCLRNRQAAHQMPCRYFLITICSDENSFFPSLHLTVSQKRILNYPLLFSFIIIPAGINPVKEKVIVRPKAELLQEKREDLFFICLQS